ncbi:cell division protein FtsA [Candidatus Adlerbacteria bacterium RIFOXYC1_FULL_48_26]|uniref:Cell division protein FtsA n=1 Tax=Candidatus Adlerbacteria bacterium RIFOXYC1_FULL_48_26 TaxID=1797247 RepID=A0A1F4Y377_9BACT|nr:MAG: cell division protein FtsA [Candidatus Adlerbacteria bacterium RIFOXYC1_FULL_48_26]OGC93501.1 MAG: cell division protein FtsA [Candidatus Adlerbacteria bacterium RIFOXYB1_FULL_48_10]
MSKIVTGIDVGTYHVKVVIAESADDPRQPPRILGTGYAESRGVKNGYIISQAETTRSIAAAVAQASKAAHTKVKRAYVSISGIGVDEAFSRGETVVERGDSEITERDIPRAIAASEKSLAPAAIVNRKIIHTIPLRFSVDGVKVMGRSPVGMKGMRIAVESLFITCLDRHVSDLVSAVEEAGVEVEDVVAGPLAASFVALTKMQKRVGCILANIGAETFSIIVFEDNTPISIKVFPVGAANITNELALGLRIAPEDAEQLKQGAVLGAPFPKKKIDDIIAKKVLEMLKLAEAHLKKIGKDELLPAGIVLTGGGSLIQGVADLAKTALRLPARTASLAEGAATKMQLKDGSWAVAYGLTLWGLTSGGDLEVRDDSTFGDIVRSLWRWFKKFLP